MWILDVFFKAIFFVFWFKKCWFYFVFFFVPLALIITLKTKNIDKFGPSVGIYWVQVGSIEKLWIAIHVGCIWWMESPNWNYLRHEVQICSKRSPEIIHIVTKALQVWDITKGNKKSVKIQVAREEGRQKWDWFFNITFHNGQPLMYLIIFYS